jgi:hypothetical protein
VVVAAQQQQCPTLALLPLVEPIDYGNSRHEFPCHQREISRVACPVEALSSQHAHASLLYRSFASSVARSFAPFECRECSVVCCAVDSAKFRNKFATTVPFLYLSFVAVVVWWVANSGFISSL